MILFNVYLFIAIFFVYISLSYLLTFIEARMIKKHKKIQMEQEQTGGAILSLINPETTIKLPKEQDEGRSPFAIYSALILHSRLTKQFNKRDAILLGIAIPALIFSFIKFTEIGIIVPVGLSFFFCLTFAIVVWDFKHKDRFEASLHSLNIENVEFTQQVYKFLLIQRLGSLLRFLFTLAWVITFFYLS